MLVIRLTRTGKKKQAYFRVVVQEKHKAPGAKFVEILGNYDPHSKKLEVDKDKVTEYMKKGAQPSNSLAKLLKKEGVKLPSWVNITERNRAPKKKDEEQKTEEKKETPTEEKKEETVEAEKPVGESKSEADTKKESKDNKKETPKTAEEEKKDKPEEAKASINKESEKPDPAK